MKRLVIVFLLVFLPLQMSWGAVTAYCEHEQGTSAQHFGHHAHQHKSTADSAKQSKDSKLKLDPDCAFCHHGWVKLACGHVFIPAPVAHRDHVIHDVSKYDSYIPDGPQRPNWRAAS